jgi:WD40 repeat protein
MSPSAPEPTGIDQQFEEAVAEFLRLCEAGAEPDHEQFLLRFPGLEARLREYFTALTFCNGSGTTLLQGPGRVTPGASGEPGIAGFEILGELGRGGMGVVYRARQTKLDRVVALKMIRSGVGAGPRERARFAIEARSAARLQHPHIVQVFEIGEYQDTGSGAILPYLVLELVEGGTLSARCRGELWEPRRAAELIEKLARTVDYAHQCGIVHRDLKPANVMMTPTGIPKITDFGLAKRLDAGDDLTGSGVMLGTPAYMAPEQAVGKNDTIGPAADVWSLGVLLYELLTGRVPFKGASALDTLTQVREDDPVPPARLVPQLPRDLQTICLKCLHKEPARRYASAQDLATDLRRFLDGEPIQARATGWAERLWLLARRNPVVAGLVTLAVVLLLAVTVVSVAFALHAAARRDEAERARKNADKLTENLRETVADLTRQKYRSDFVAYAFHLLDAQQKLEARRLSDAAAILRRCDPELRGWEHAYLSSRAQRLLLTFPVHGYLTDALAFSPDGDRLATWGTDTADQQIHTLRLWNAWTGEQVFSTRTTDAGKGLVYTPDGNRLILLGSGIRVLEARTCKEILKIPAESCFVMGASPDSKLLAGVVGREQLKVWDVQSGQVLRSVEDAIPRNVGAQVGFSADSTRVGVRTIRGEKVWEVATGEPGVAGPGFRWTPDVTAESADGKRRAVAAAGETLLVQDIATGAELFILPRGVGVTPRRTALSPDGNRLAMVTDGSHALQVWDIRTDPDVLLCQEHPDLKKMLLALAFSPDGKRIAAVGDGPRVQVLDARTGKEVWSVLGPDRWNRSATFSPDGTRLATASIDRMIYIRDAGTGFQVAQLKGHTRPVNSVAYSPDQKSLASGGEDGTVRLWDLETGQEVQTLLGHVGHVLAVAFDPKDANRLASASADGTVRLWDAHTGETLFVLLGRDRINSLCYSPDGRLLASAHEDGTVLLWDTRTGTEVAALTGHTKAVVSVSFSADGTRLASVGRDDRVKVWDPRSGQEALTVKLAVYSTAVCFSPDGITLGLVGEDFRVRLLRAERPPWR